MIKRFFKWIEKGGNVQIYQYPKIKKNNKKYLVKFNDGSQEYWNNLYVSNIIHFDKNDIIYLGNRQWAFVINQNTLFGTPEMSDNYLNSLNKRWTANVVNKKPQLTKLIHEQNSIKKYKKTKKYVAP